MKLSKLFLGILLTVSFIFTVNFMDIHAANADTLVVHYQRFDGNEDDWFLWLWYDGIDQDAEHYFDGTDAYGVTATVDIASEYGDINTLGIIIRDASWAKDTSDDRFIDLSQPNGSGEVHAYFLQGQEFISYVATDQAGCDHNIPDPYLCAQSLPTGLVDVYIDTNKDVKFISTESLDAADITVYKEGIAQVFTGFTSGAQGTLNITNTVDVTSNYTIEIDYGTEVVTSIIRVNADYDSTLFNQAYNYSGDLGVEYGLTETTFRLWAPVSSQVFVNLYTAGHTTSLRADGVNDPYSIVEMDYLEKGVWEVTIAGDLHGVYYTYTVKNSGSRVTNIQDPYGQTFGLNGARSMVIDMDRVNPAGWDTDTGVDGYENPNDAIIYELHVRDLTSQDAWGGPSEYQGTYMGFTVEDTTYTNPQSGVTVSTGLDHLIELGITHVHLLPTYDQDGWNDERDFEFNWGYNPQHYNSPEGGYATDPFDGSIRVNEYKQMVMALHNNGINVINDVVYNHTADAGSYSFNKVVPGYFFRFNNDGSYSNGSGVGNETASERFMVNKFIVDSVVYWAEEYHIDGFRFDLMAIHDYTTMNDLSAAAEAIDPDIFVYGEPWGGGTIALDWNQQAGKNTLWRMPLVSAFNDNFRNAIKGSPDGSDGGYITNSQNVYNILDGLEGSFDYGDWTHNVSNQVINYVTAHDNLTLYDKLKLATGASGYTKEIDYQARLANSIVMFSQGVPFLHAGVDFLRTKGGDHNSYNASDQVNQLNWVRKSVHVNSFEYYKGIIEVRKAYQSFDMQTEADIDANFTNLNPDGYGLIGIRLQKNTEDILIYFNGGAYSNDIILPSGAWKLLVDRDEAGLTGMGTYSTRYPIEEAETLVFVKGNAEDVTESPSHKPEITNAISVVYEGVSYRVTSTTSIAAYSVDNGDWVELDTAKLYALISGLSLGTHELRIKDAFGGISDVFTVTVIANPNDVSCDVDPTQDKCEPPTCDEGYELVDDECVLVEEPEPTCDTDQVLVNGVCVYQEVKTNTGCFSTIGNKQPITFFIIGGISSFAAGILIFLRKK